MKRKPATPLTVEAEVSDIEKLTGFDSEGEHHAQ